MPLSFRIRVHFPLWALVMVPAVCAPLFLWLAMSNRADRGSIEEQWIHHPSVGFPIKDGDWVGRHGDLGYVASVRPRNDLPNVNFREIYALRPKGVLDCRIHTGSDSWSESTKAMPGLPARLPALIQKLPLSDQLVDPRNRVVVAFAGDWRWVVRSYRFPGPKEVGDLIKAMRPSDDPSGN